MHIEMKYFLLATNAEKIVKIGLKLMELSQFINLLPRVLQRTIIYERKSLLYL